MAKISRTQHLADSLAPVGDAALAVLDVIPGLSIAVGLLKAHDDFRNRALAKKLAAFMNGLGAPEDVKRAAHDAQARDPAQHAQIGEVLIFTLDNFTDTLKCQLLGKLYWAFLLGLLSGSELRRLALCIQVAFSDDLTDFVNNQINELTPFQPFHQYLQNTGLTESTGGFDGGLPSLTPIGRKMKEALAALPNSTYAVPQ